MAKYRIVEVISHDEKCKYYIQKRLLYFFWVYLECYFFEEIRLEIFETLESAENRINELHEREKTKKLKKLKKKNIIYPNKKS